ncbi:DUF4330 domain-containing protein [Clostridiaceae bacterium M8S5]|nr:DUF4330 domain-containing protein [Clostridiaceae bacterium M8S5]
MKLIDKKGKLFGLINIIDLLVILIVVLAVGGIGYKLKTRQGIGGIGSKTEKVKAIIEISDVRLATVNNLNEGDKLYHYDRGNYFGTVKEVAVFPHKEAVSTSDGKIVLAEEPDKFDVQLTLESNASVSDSVIVIGGEHSRVGAQFRLKNKKVAVMSTVLKIEETE